MKIKGFILFTISIIIFSCSNIEKSNKKPALNYTYKIEAYYNIVSPENYQYSEFYDSNDKILRRSNKDEVCINFYYDTLGRLAKKVKGRNCTGGNKSELVYDDNENWTGYKGKFYSKSLKDTFDLTQLYQYDSLNRIIVDRLDYTIHDKTKYNYYGKNRLLSSIIVEDNDTVWNISYRYNQNDLIDSTIWMQDTILKIESFKYDSLERLIYHKTTSNKYLISSRTKLMVDNTTITYKYNKNSIITEKKILNHKDEEIITTLYEIKSNL